MSFRILCDFDGTIALDDVTDRLLEQFALPHWREVEAEWLAGRIGSRECMARQVALLRATRADIDRVVDAVPIDPHFPAFVQRAKALAAEVLVVSDGLDYAIRRVLARCSLDHLPIFANRLEFTGERSCRLAFPHAAADCAKASGTCKCAIAAAGGGHGCRILVGDGASDFCAAGSVDLVFAKDRLLDHCRSQGLPHRAIDDFSDATFLLDTLVRGPVAAPACCSLALEPV
ncbi:MAG: MtnX-like HAD-IB family phosphatase [Bacteroidota bacterium]